MSVYDYYVMKLGDELYIEPMMTCLGEALDYCVNEVRLSGQQALIGFIESGMAHEFEHRNPVYGLGKSGIELSDFIVEQVLGVATVDESALVETHAESCIPCQVSCTKNPGSAGQRHDPWASWIGEMLVFYQMKSGCSYRRIVEALPYDRLVELAIVYASEATPESFAEILDERIAEQPRISHLQKLRAAAKLSQAQLAKRARVSLRAIQQYEQGSKNINHAQAAALYRIAFVLDCTIEDLLESPVE